MMESSLVVVLVVHICAIATVEVECDAPVSIDVDSPLAFSTTSKWVKSKARCIEIPDIRCRIQPRKNPADL